MYLFNSKTGELKMANQQSQGFAEITHKKYKELQLLEVESRIGLLPDLDVNQLNANLVKVGDNDKRTNIKPEGVESNGGIVGKNGAETTVSVDAKTGNVDTIGNVTAAGGDFKTKPTTLDAKGVKSPIATMSDIDASSKGIAQITSPNKSITVGGSPSNTTLDVVPATATQLGGVKAGPTVVIGADGLLNIIMADGSHLGGVRVIGGSSGIRIDSTTAIISVDPSISPLDYLGTFDASKNEGGDDKHKISDSDNPDIYHGGFYVVSVRGSVVLAHGTEVFEEGDWAIFEQIEGKAGGKWVAVPVGKYQAVHSVNGKVGTVVLVKADVGLGNVQNVDQTNADNLASGTVKVGVNTSQNISTTGQMMAATLVITDKLTFVRNT